MNDASRPRGPRTSRAAAGLPERGVVFACFNVLYKITPAIFRAWMAILRAVPGSVLWLLEGAPVAVRNLKRAAEASGIGSARLVFAPALEHEPHWARCALADLFLDTTPTNAHTTASDALWAGVPVLTLAGETFTSRVATSLLSAVGLESLSVATCADYVRLAVELASDEERLAHLHAQLEEARMRAPLFHTGRYCSHLEQGLAAAWARHLRGEPPADINVAPLPGAAP